MVKSKGWEEAYFWLISHRKEIHSMGYPSENEIIEYTDDFDEDELSLPFKKISNVFGLLSSVLRNPKVKSVSGGIYDTFEEAVSIFMKKISRHIYRLLESKLNLENCYIFVLQEEHKQTNIRKKHLYCFSETDDFFGNIK